MHRRSARLLVLPALILLALGVSLVAQDPKPGFADPVLGRWDLTVKGADASYPSWLEVRLRKETQLQGRFVGRFGSVRNATEVDYRDGELTVVVPVQYERNKTDLGFRGKLVGDALEGTTEDENGKTITWKAVRAPGVKPASAPTWGSPVSLVAAGDLTGWKPRSGDTARCWQVTDGTLAVTPPPKKDDTQPPCVDLVTERAFGDFKLHAEFMYPKGSNSGIYLRGRYEVQIQDDAGRALDPLRMGGVYGFLTPYSDAARSAGAWQTYDISLVGRRVTIILNGTTIVENEVIPGITGGALDSNEGAPGPLMLQGDHGAVSFRNIRVTPAQ
jgi:Domain of Unknown Function (DUF1080)